MARLTYQLTSPPEEEDLIAELMLNGRDFGHVTLREGVLDLVIYFGESDSERVAVSTLLETIDEIRQRLTHLR